MPGTASRSRDRSTREMILAKLFGFLRRRPPRCVGSMGSTEGEAHGLSRD
jgi:hypothetical protein